MAISCNFTDNATWLKMMNQATRQEFSEVLLQAIADQRFVDGRYLVLDYQGYQTDISSDDLRDIVFLLAGIKEKISQPIITIVSDPYHFGLMRMLQSFSQSHGVELKICRNERETLNLFPVFWSDTNGAYRECL